MQVGRTRLSHGEWKHLLSAKVCLFCGQAGYFLADCPSRRNELGSSTHVGPFPFRARSSGAGSLSPCHTWWTPAKLQAPATRTWPCKVKLVTESDLVSPSEPQPPPCIVDGGACHQSPEHPGCPSTGTRVPVPG